MTVQICAAVLATTLTAVTAYAAPVPPQTAVNPLIYGGSVTPACAWPGTVMLYISDGTTDALCTGSLVHPQIVVYAAHCTENVKIIGFGEHPLTLATRKVVPESCHVYQGHVPENGSDFAYCKLAAPITDVPITPILMGCELEALQPNKSIVLVGYGLDENNQVGIKRQTTTVQDAMLANKAFVGGNGHDTCSGDSGGPAFVQLNDGDVPGAGDGAWRVYGITSYGPTSACGTGSYDSIISNAVPWIEADSGLDITPCHDANGVWQPGPDCGGFPLNPEKSIGTWTTGCKRKDITAYSATCGPPFDANSPLRISFINPASNQTLKVSDTLAPSLAVQNTDPAGGTISVTLTYDGDEVKRDGTSTPYKFQAVTLSDGLHTLLATATDAKGHKRIQQLNLDVSNASGGCQQSSRMGGWCVIALFVWLVRARRRVDWAVLLAMAMTLIQVGACADVHLTTSSNKVVGEVTNPAPNPDFGPVPAVTYSLNGNVAAHSFEPHSALYFYGEQQASTSDPISTYLAMVIADQNNYCTAFQQNTDKSGAKYYFFLVFNADARADAPTDGTFTVVDPNAAVPATGLFASAQFYVNNPNCNNTLPDSQAWAQSGNLIVKTILSTQGAYIHTTLDNLSFGSQRDPVSGSFTALGCALPESPPKYTCNP